MSSLSGRRLPVAEGLYPWSGERTRRMNATPDEFRRALVQAFGNAVGESPGGVELCVDDVRLHFALTALPPRNIGALQIADLRVEIRVLAGDTTAARKLLDQVDRATQRGGG